MSRPPAGVKPKRQVIKVEPWMDERRAYLTVFNKSKRRWQILWPLEGGDDKD